MGHVTIINTIILAFPEYICACATGLLLIGKHDMFINKNSYSKVLFYAVLSSIVYFLVKPLISDSIEWSVVYIVSSAIFYIFIFKFHYFESLMASLFQFILITILESITLVPLAHIFDLNSANTLKNTLILFAMSVPVRLIHIVFIIFIFNNNFKILNFANKPLGYKRYYANMFLYLIVSLFTIFLLGTVFKILFFESFKSNNFEILLKINIIILPLIILLLALAMKNDTFIKKKQTELSKKEFIQNLDYIDDLITKEKYIEAIDSLNNLKDFISSNDI